MDYVLKNKLFLFNGSLSIFLTIMIILFVKKIVDKPDITPFIIPWSNSVQTENVFYHTTDLDKDNHAEIVRGVYHKFEKKFTISVFFSSNKFQRQIIESKIRGNPIFFDSQIDFNNDHYNDGILIYQLNSSEIKFKIFNYITENEYFESKATKLPTALHNQNLLSINLVRKTTIQNQPCILIGFQAEQNDFVAIYNMISNKVYFVRLNGNLKDITQHSNKTFLLLESINIHTSKNTKLDLIEFSFYDDDFKLNKIQEFNSIIKTGEKRPLYFYHPLTNYLFFLKQNVVTDTMLSIVYGKIPEFKFDSITIPELDINQASVLHIKNKYFLQLFGKVEPFGLSHYIIDFQADSIINTFSFNLPNDAMKLNFFKFYNNQFIITSDKHYLWYQMDNIELKPFLCCTIKKSDLNFPFSDFLILRQSENQVIFLENTFFRYGVTISFTPFNIMIYMPILLLIPVFFYFFQWITTRGILFFMFYKTLRSILNESSKGLLILDIHGNIRYINKYAGKIIETSCISPPQLHVNLLSILDQNSILYDIINTLINKNQIISNNIKLNIQERTAEIYISGKIMSFLHYFSIGYFVEMTEITQLLKYERDDIWYRSFKKTMSFFETPLTSINIINSNIILSLKKDKRLDRKKLLQLTENINNSLRTIQQTRKKFEKIIEIKEITPTAIPLTTLLERALARFENYFNNKIKLSVKLPEEPIILSADPDLLQLAIENIVENSIDSMKGEGLLIINTSLIENPFRNTKNYIELSITDSGIGIEKQYQHLMFEPYFTTKPFGTGLGLAIVKRIIQVHGGNINVDSNVGVGTTIRFTIPINSKGG